MNLKRRINYGRYHKINIQKRHIVQQRLKFLSMVRGAKISTFMNTFNCKCPLLCMKLTKKSSKLIKLTLIISYKLTKYLFKSTNRYLARQEIYIILYSRNYISHRRDQYKKPESTGTGGSFLDWCTKFIKFIKVLLTSYLVLSFETAHTRTHAHWHWYWCWH